MITMAGPLEALDQHYHRLMQWVSELPHIGLPSSAVGSAVPSMLPSPQLAEINRRSKDPHILGVRLDDGTVVHLLAPMAHWHGRKLTHELVRAGVHPEDILIASADFGKSDDPSWTIRNCIEWLFWTVQDQRDLEQEIGGVE